MHAKDAAVAAALVTVLEAQDPGTLVVADGAEDKSSSHLATQITLHEAPDVPSPIYCGKKEDGDVVCMELAHFLGMEAVDGDRS